MILGTHNSGTGEKLVWWQRPFSFILNPMAKCQSRNIVQQLRDGIKLFNLQVTRYNGRWVFSHGICIYDMDLLDVIKLMKKHATEESPIYYQLYYDRNFLTGTRNIKAFKELVSVLKAHSKKENVKLLFAWVEGTTDYPFINRTKLDVSEHYWTTAWAKDKPWVDKLPLPKRHAKKYNKEYIKYNSSEYLMLDFYEYK